MPSSTEFNAECYIARYPDLQDRSIQRARRGLPLEEQFGWMYKSTDGKWHYGRTNNRKLKRIQDDPYWHWINFGMSEGRVPGCDLPGTYYEPIFDAAAYIARYPDVSGKSYSGSKNPYINNPLGHWLEIGQKQGRKPGYELLNNEKYNGIVSVGAAKFQPFTDTQGRQQEYEDKTQSPGTGTRVDSGTELPEQPVPGKSNLILIAAIAVGGYLLLKNKKRGK